MQDLKELKQEIDDAVKRLDIDALAKKNDEYLQQMNLVDFWADAERAQKMSKEQSSIQKRLDFWRSLQAQATDLCELSELDDPTLVDEITTQQQKVAETFAAAKRELQLSGPYDQHGVMGQHAAAYVCSLGGT